MKTNRKKIVFWGPIVAALILLLNVLRHLFGGKRNFAYGPHGFARGGMGQPGGFGNRGGFAARQMMHGYYHHAGFQFGSLLCLLIVIALLIFLMKWLKSKLNSDTMNQLIDTPMIDTQMPVTNLNGQVLDQWEKNLLTKKENEENGNF